MSPLATPEAVSAKDQALIDAYLNIGRPLDALPYTRQFDDLMKLVGDQWHGSEQAVFHRLLALRKGGLLAPHGRQLTGSVHIAPEEEALLEEMVRDRLGTLGQRDQLPFTTNFDEICAQFNHRIGRNLQPADVWRLIARLAK